MVYPNSWTCPSCGALVNNSAACTVCNYTPPAESGQLAVTSAQKKDTLLKERIIAFLIDILVLSTIIVVSLFIFIAMQPGEKPIITILNVLLTPVLLGGFVIHPLYLFLIEVLIKGRSYGKMIMKLKAVSLDGSRISTTQSLVRNLMRFAEALTLYIISIYYIRKSAESQRLGDRVAGTKVVRV